MSVLEKFHYQVTGPESGRKLVFLHGVMGFSANWRRIAKAFEDRFQILVFDQRGHGRSFRPPIGYAPEDYSHDLREILDELKWSKINLVGHSMGGRVALHFANEFPECVTRLVIEDIGPSMYQSGASLVTRMLDAVPVPFATKSEAKRWFDHDFLEIFKTERNVHGLAAYLYANLTENDQHQAVWRFYEPGIRESVEQGRASERWGEIEHLSMPTLVLRGQNSKDLPLEIYDRMIASNPQIRGIEIADSGHWIHSEKPDEFIRVLSSFLT
jgi:esterase